MVGASDTNNNFIYTPDSEVKPEYWVTNIYWDMYSMSESN